jgi:hypothetical protein
MLSLQGIEDLRKKLGLPAGGAWSGVTPTALIALQQGRGTYPMVPSGRLDPATALNAGYYPITSALAADQMAYVTGNGAKPGTVSRDFATSTAQIPWWGWTLLGVSFVGLGGYLYYRAKKGAK